MPKNRLIKCSLYLLAIFILLAFSYFKVFETYELHTLDLRFQLRPPLKISPDIVIIEIDEATVNESGGPPFTGHYPANLIDGLRQLGARAVVFDIMFTATSQYDEQLINNTRKARELIYYPVVLKFDGYRSKGRFKSDYIEVSLIDELYGSAKGVGFINSITDPDGKIRRAPLEIDCGGKEYFQLAYLVAKDYLGEKLIKAPVGDDGMMLVNYPGKWNKSFKRHSFSDVLMSFFQTYEGEKGTINLSGAFYNKICFVSETEAGGRDLKANPIEPAYPMIGVYASIFNSIIRNEYVARAHKLLNLVLLFVLCLVIALIANNARSLSGLGMAAAAVALFVSAGFILFIYSGLWIDLFCPIVMATAVYLGFTVKRYLVEKHNSLLMEGELSIAKKIQMDFLPQSVPQMEGVEIASSIDTAKAVGGDLYDFADFANVTLIGQRKLGIMIGDVSGKGIPAALFMARAIADFRHFVGDKVKPSAVLDELNKQIALNYKAGLFITMFYMIYDTDKNLIFSNAGHLPAILLKASGEIAFLKTKGTALGLVETESYSDSTAALKAGDSIILYTDGITEARNGNKEEFGEERLKEIILKNYYASPLPMINAIKNELSKFVGSQPRHDDCTLIILKIKE